MTIGMFLIALGVASALLAFWFVVRFPNLGPEDSKRAMIHVGAALALGWFVPDIFNLICAYGYAAALTALFALVLPVVFYTFLSGAWWLRIATDAMNQYRH
jgi:hypothetical protein